MNGWKGQAKVGKWIPTWVSFFSNTSGFEYNEVHFESSVFCLSSVEMKEQGFICLLHFVAFVLLKVSTHSFKALLLAIDFISSCVLCRVWH